MAPSDASSSTTLPTVTLYQYEPCPYCCKVKAVLDYLRIPYNVVEVNPLTKKETKPLTEYKKVPVCQINGEVVIESSAIISRLRELVRDQEKDAQATGGVPFGEEEKWRKWVDETLVRSSMLLNARRTLKRDRLIFVVCAVDRSCWRRQTSTARSLNRSSRLITASPRASSLRRNATCPSTPEQS